MKVYEGIIKGGYNSQFDVDISKDECDCCKKETFVMYTDNEMHEYYNGQYCLDCIKKFFDLANKE